MKARFSGHDTFPLRYGWLFKAVNLLKNKGLLSTADVSRASAAIAELGVGKNMVSAIRYWAENAQVISSGLKDREVVQAPTHLGYALFDEFGADPFLEDIGSVWLIHWLLNSSDDGLTAYRYFFAYSTTMYFEKGKLTDDLVEAAVRLTGNSDVKKATIKKDVDCFLNTYVGKAQRIAETGAGKLDEDSFSSPLSELGLIKDMGGGYFQCDFKAQESLPVNIFLFSLVSWAARQFKLSGSVQFSFDEIYAKPHSPGKVFRLSEKALGELLDRAVSMYPTEITWIDSQGLKQVNISDVWLNNPVILLKKQYPGAVLWES